MTRAQAPAPARSASRAPLRTTLFPGDRRIWLCAAAVAAAGAIVLLVALLVPRDFYTGTNSIRARSFPVEMKAGDLLCVPSLEVPSGTGRVQVQVDTGGKRRPPVEGGLTDAGGRSLGVGTVPAGKAGPQKISFAVPELARTSIADFCLRSAGKIFIGGVGDLQGNDQPVRLNGQENRNRIALWYLPPRGEKRSLISHPGEILGRAALLRPSWVGEWTYWVLLLVAMPAMGYAAIRTIAAAPGRSSRRMALTVALLALLNGWTWALVSTPFNAPDESEHWAYVQYLAETGHITQRQGAVAPRGVYSADEAYALDTVRILTWSESRDGRPPWTPRAEAGLRARQIATPGGVPRDDGGGPTPATWVHSPAYYGTLTPGYLVARGGSTWDQLTLARFLSAVYAAIAAACAFLLVRELVPRHPALAAASGMMVAFHPMFGFIGGAVNNDNGVNAAAAGAIFLTVRALRRGLTVRSGLALGAVVAIAPIFKATGYSLYPLIALALLGLLVRRHARRDLIGYAAVAAGFVGVLLAWGALSKVFEESTVTAAGASGPATGALGDPATYLSYLWQVFLPPLPFMTDLFAFRWPFFNIYIERGWGAFGWYAVGFPVWVYATILLVTVAVGALGVRAAVTHRGWVHRHWLEVAFVALAPAAVIAAVEAAYFAPGPRGVLPEFGRYLFPAITALAAMAAGSCLGLGRRWAPVAAAGLATAVVVLDYASQILSLAGFYS